MPRLRRARSILLLLRFQDTAAATTPATKPNGSSSRKRKSQTSLEDDIAAYKQDLGHVYVDDIPIDASCNQVRGKINKLVDSGIMKKVEFCRATGLSSQNLSGLPFQEGD